MPGTRDGSGGYDRQTSDRLSRVEAELNAERRLADERYRNLSAGITRIERLVDGLGHSVRAIGEVARDSRESSRQASSAVSVLSRQVMRMEEVTDRHPAVPMQVRTGTTARIPVGPDPSGDDDLLRGIRDRKLGGLITIATIIGSAVVAAVTAAWAVVTGGK